MDSVLLNLYLVANDLQANKRGCMNRLENESMFSQRSFAIEFGVSIKWGPNRPRMAFRRAVEADN